MEFASSLVFLRRGKDEWANWGTTNTIEVELQKGKNQLEIGFESYKENMNGDVNQFLLDEIILEKNDGAIKGFLKIGIDVVRLLQPWRILFETIRFY